MCGQGEHPHPGCQLDGQGDDGAPDLVLGEVVQRQVPQSGGLGDPDPVLAAGPAAMAQFQVGQLPTGGVGRERGDPVPVGISDPQLRAGVAGVPCAR